jgi:sugar/nucleoside kinase (ribokinase family)
MESEGAAGGGHVTGAERLLVVGDVINDVIVRPSQPRHHATDNPARIAFAAGGSAANQAAWAAHHGADVSFVGRVGMTDLARHTETLSRAGVDAHLVPDRMAATGSIVVLVDDDGERTMYVDRGANQNLTIDDIRPELLDGADRLHLTGYLFFTKRGQSAGRALLRQALAAGLAVSLDPSSAYHLRRVGGAEFRSWTEGIELCLPNHLEARILAETDDLAVAYERLRATYGTTVVKHGADGVTVLDPTGDLEQLRPARRRAAVDSTGAGDAFAGALLSRLCRGEEVPAAARFAIDAAGEVVTRLGGRPLPT